MKIAARIPTVGTGQDRTRKLRSAQIKTLSPYKELRVT